VTGKIKKGNLALARRIRAAGIAIHINEDDEEVPRDPSTGLLIYQAGGVSESRMFDYFGGTGYMINAAITVNVPLFAIARFGLELPWKGPVRWLEDPLEADGSAMYRFGGDEALEFERNHVLNHFANVRRTWSRGESLQGLLLGTVDAPIPTKFRHGMKIPGFLIVYDQFWREYRSSVSLWLDRHETATRRALSGHERLFSRRDPT
jgi:hypothetical protein